ncbi:hypothetical protein AB0953_33225 [Streptomyces sp. NPDC046866]|uniref:hypothetical protein n=1 Tax=Streptomyces sp. NPDC046866 TaxID=3154921 RepID=UPI0034513B34
MGTATAPATRRDRHGPGGRSRPTLLLALARLISLAAWAVLRCWRAGAPRPDTARIWPLR